MPVNKLSTTLPVTALAHLYAAGILDTWTRVVVLGENTTTPNDQGDVDIAADGDAGGIGHPTEGGQFKVASSDNGDTVNVLAELLDEDFVATSYTVTLTGQTPVNIGGADSIRCNSLRIVGGTAAAGDVRVAATAAWTAGVPDDLTTTQRRVVAGEILSRDAYYTVPDGYRLWLETVAASFIGTGVFALLTREQTAVGDGDPLLPARIFPDDVLAAGLLLPTHTDIVLRGQPVADDTRGVATLVGYLIPDTDSNPFSLP